MKKLLWGFLIFCAIGLLGNLLPDTNSKASTGQLSQSSQVEHAPRPDGHAEKMAKPGSKPEASQVTPIELYEDTCLHVAGIFGQENELTNLQKEERWKQYEGKVFRWDLKITEITSGFLSGFNVQAICNGSESLIQDVMISYPNEAKDILMKVKVGSVVKVKGRLKHDGGELLGIMADGLLE